MNLLKKIINDEFDLEIGEEFEIENCINGMKFYFTKGIDDDISLFSYYDSNISASLANSNYLYTILNHPEKIKKLPWKPKKGDIYYEILGNKIFEQMFNGEIRDYTNYIISNCFKTREMAEKNYAKYNKILKTMYEKGQRVDIFEE